MTIVVWRYLDPRGETVGRSDPFPDREAAESWLGASWADLLEGGTEAVVMEEDGAEVYRMSLRSDEGDH